MHAAHPLNVFVWNTSPASSLSAILLIIWSLQCTGQAQFMHKTPAEEGG